MKLTEIQELIKFVSRSGVTEVEIEQKDFKIIIKSEPKKSRNDEKETIYVQAPQIGAPIAAVSPIAATPQITVAEQEAPNMQENSKLITIKSPMIGTFYRSPGPDKDVFVNVGDSIKTGDVICIVEAMKLFNEIEAEVNGKIVKVLIDDASPIEYDQPLFLVDPS